MSQAAAKGVIELRKFLNLSFALALVAGLFAGSLASVGATSPTYGPQVPGNNMLFFPFVHNGTTEEGMKFTGAVDIQNLEVFPINVTLMDASGATLAGPFLLNPRASKTWGAAALGVKAGGGGVIAVASYPQSSIDEMLALGMCKLSSTPYDQTVTRGSDLTTTDTFSPDVPIAVDNTGAPIIDSITQGGTTYVEGTDFTAVVNSDGTVTITWIGAKPAPNTQYVVEYETTDCGQPSIGGVEKHSADTGGSVVTNANQTTVDGSNAVPLCDLAYASNQQTSACVVGNNLAGTSVPELSHNNQFRWILPIVQTNNGWNSIIHVTNVSGNSGVGVNVYYYTGGGQGVAGPSIQLLSTTLGSGETADIDLSTMVPAGSVGSVWIDSDDWVVASVDRLKAETSMALTNVAQPRLDNIFNYFKIFGLNPTTKYAPLIFRDYNNWNTGLNIANLSSNTNQVTITYHNYSDNAVSQETVNIPPRAMEYVYRPGNGSDAGLSVGNISAAVITGSDPIAVAVDEVKYSGNAQPTQGVGQAMSYIATEGAYAGQAWDTGEFPFMANFVDFGFGRVVFSNDLSLPLVQKGSDDSGMGDFSGINLFNGDANHGVDAWVLFEDSSGLPVAPTTGANERELPFKLSLPALGSAIVYTANYSEMPSGFVGSAVVGSMYPTAESMRASAVTGPLVAVSNNVNYAVQNDGSAVYSLYPYWHFLPTFNTAGCLYPGRSTSQGGPLACLPIPLSILPSPAPPGNGG
jgi:hypothetical protein